MAKAPSAVVILAWWTCSASVLRANVDLEWRQEPGVVNVNDIVRIGLYAVSDDGATHHLMAGMDVIVSWDPVVLQLLGVDNNGPYSWINSSFPSSDPFGLNEVIPPQDGDGLYLAQGDFTLPEATPAGLLVTTFEFQALANTCGTALSIVASAGSPPTQTVVWSGIVPGTSITGVLGSATIAVGDTTAPVFAQCGDITVDVDGGAGGPCEVVVDPSTMIAVTDDCDPNPASVCVRDDGLDCFADPYPCGVTTLTWTATDTAGNTSTCVQTVTANGFAAAVTVELQGVSAPLLSRCITFEFHSCGAGGPSCTGQPDPLIVDQVMTFVGGVGSATFRVPCDGYACVTARDKLHTLRRTISPIPNDGSQYVADFTAANGKELIGGNLNDDCWIDVLDFGLLAGAWNTFPAANADCSVSFPPVHADLSGNGRVFSSDYTFIQLNMWAPSDPNCCGAAPPCGGQLMAGGGPIERISLADLERAGLDKAVVGDLNGDAWLDVDDIVLWMRGERPRLKPTPCFPTREKRSGAGTQRIEDRPGRSTLAMKTVPSGEWRRRGTTREE